MLSAERLAELRHVAEQAGSLPNGPWGHRYLSEFIPGVVLELLDMIEHSDDEFTEAFDAAAARLYAERRTVTLTATAKVAKDNP